MLCPYPTIIIIIYFDKYPTIIITKDIDTCKRGRDENEEWVVLYLWVGDLTSTQHWVAGVPLSWVAATINMVSEEISQHRAMESDQVF